MINSFLEEIPKNTSGINEMQILNLAYIGDAVFEIMVRTHIINTNKSKTDELHKTAKSYVRAEAQAEMYRRLTETLTDEEISVMRRGRNAKSQSKAKNASIAVYKYATGMEALFGYLYLRNEIARLMELFEICIQTSVTPKER